MRPKFRIILEQCIDEGVCAGYWRSRKHVENPSPEAIIENISEAVMGQMYQYFDFPEETYSD